MMMLELVILIESTHLGDPQLLLLNIKNYFEYNLKKKLDYLKGKFTLNFYYFIIISIF